MPGMLAVDDRQCSLLTCGWQQTALLVLCCRYESVQHCCTDFWQIARVGAIIHNPQH